MNTYSLNIDLVIGVTYRFTYKNIVKDKVYIGDNEKRIAMFDHVSEKRRSFVDKNKVITGIKIEKLIWQ